MRIAFFDHSYHKKTRSSDFITKLLGEIGNVRVFYDETWRGGTHPLNEDFNETDYELIVVWQVDNIPSLLSGRHPNVLFVPMDDSMLRGNQFHWSTEFNEIKVLSFSWKLHQEVSRRGAWSKIRTILP